MVVLLRRIPANTNKHEILEFVEPALKGGLLSKTGQIETIKILIVKDNQRNTVEYHGLVRIEPESAALRVIKKLDHKPINGKNIVVREYHIRNWHNDLRVRPKQLTPRIERRRNDRRRSKLEIFESQSAVLPQT